MRPFWFKTLIVTCITIALTWASSRIAALRVFQLLFPESIAIKEFEFTDFAFDLKLTEHINDQITIINIGELNRSGIAELINTLNTFQPEVIGIDVFFNCHGEFYDTIHCPQLRDKEGMENLSRAIRSANDVVLVTQPLRSRRKSSNMHPVYDSLEVSDTIFSKGVASGHALLSTLGESAEDVLACRTFDPRIELTAGTYVNAFAVEVAMLYDSVKARRFLVEFQKDDEVVINYKGNIVKYGYENNGSFFKETRHFYALDAQDILNEDVPEALIRGRILLLEYLGTTLTSDAAEREKLYTPLNRKKIGRTFPDMYPSVVHANIINMILTEDYIYELNPLQEFLLSFMICFFHVAALLGIRIKKPHLHDLVAVVMVIALIGLIAFLRLILFAEFNIKSDLTFTIGSLALAGIVVAVYHDMLDSRLRALIKLRIKQAEG